MKLTKQQKELLEFKLDLDNNGPDWLYSETKDDGDVRVIKRAGGLENSNTADPDYWGPEEDITDEYFELLQKLPFWE